MGTLNKYLNAAAVEEALDKGVAAYSQAEENKTDILSVKNEYEKNPLRGKKVSFLGDSICAGSEAEGRYLGGYGRIIAERNGMIYENVAHGGATIAAKTYTSEGVAKPWLCRMVENMSGDADYAIIEGGINDAWHWQSHGLEIGSISNGYTAELDDTTYYGAFESMLKQLITRFKGKKIGYIAVPKIMKYYDSERNAPNFYHIAMECCAKWGVPVCDLNTIIPPTEFLNTLGNEHSTDGVHPTYEGYLQYYCDTIEAWMKTLTTSNTAATAQKIVEAYMQGVNEAIEALQTGKLSNVGVSFRRAKLPLADGTTIEIDVLTAVDGTVIIPYTNRVPLAIDTDGSIFNGTGYQDGYRLSSSGVTKGLTGSAVTGYIPVKADDVIRIYNCGWATTNHAMNYICAYDADFIFIGSAATARDSEHLTKNGTNFISAYTKDTELNATLTLTGATIAYIRVSSNGDTGSCKGKDMIVTVNEEIT
jgi:lysophospholipase L1-like esterase